VSDDFRLGAVMAFLDLAANESFETFRNGDFMVPVLGLVRDERRIRDRRTS
jgi:hypothetical protein